MFKLMPIMFFLLSSFQCSAGALVLKCGQTTISYFDKHEVTSVVQINLGQAYVCQFNNVSKNTNTHTIEFMYQYLSFDKSDVFFKNEEKAISKFYAHEQNKYGASIYEVNLGKNILFCFNERDIEKNKRFNARCFYFKDQAKREITINDVSESFKDVRTIIKNIW